MRMHQAEIVKTGRARADAAAPAARVPGNAAHEVLALQRRIGNRAVGRLLQAGGGLDTPGDAHEQEADRLAERALPAPAARQPAGPGAQPLAPELRRHFEARLGHGFGGVRLHLSAEAAAASAALQARAFTHRGDVYFGRGQLDLRSRDGQRLLAHELVHVMQQARPGGPQGRLQRDTRWSLAPAVAAVQPGATPDQLYTYQDLYDLEIRWENATLKVARELLPDGPALAHLTGTLAGRRLSAARTRGATPIDTRLRMGNLADPAGLPHAQQEVTQRLGQVVANRYQFELARLLHHEVMQHRMRVDGAPISRAAVMDRIKDAYVTSLNDRTPWATLRREVGLAGGRRVVSTMTPVNADYDARAFGHYGSTGWASMARNLPLDAGHDRTTNLWHSELTTPDGKPVFEAFRSGSLGAKGVGTEPQQEAFSKDKAHGLLQAIAINLLRREHPQRKRRARELQRQPEQEPLQVDVVSISLQTRSPGNVAGRHIGPFDEKNDVELQREALLAWHGRQETFEGLEGLPPRTVRYNVIFFATGVNAAADFLGHRQDDINREAMPRLEKAYEAWWGKMVLQILAEPDHHVENVRELRAKMAMAAMLWQQIRAGWQWAPGYKDYRLPALVANLAYLMGHTVQYNCKSGKDRTSVMDIESKSMALRIHDWIASTGDAAIPNRLTREPSPRVKPSEMAEVYEFRSRADKQDYRRLLVEAGNLELQKLNTGAKGYKIIPKPAAEKHVADRIGKVADLVLGLTRTVEVKAKYRDEDVG